MCSLVLLSSCTLTQQQAPLSAEDAAAQKLAASELDAALVAEKTRLQKEAEAAAKAAAEEKARLEAEEKAREEAEAKAAAEEEARLEAEEKAREEAEAKAEAEEEARRMLEEQEEEEAEADEERRAPQLLSSRRKHKAEEPVTPTAEQQEAARKLLAEQEKKQNAKSARKPAPAKQADEPAPAPREAKEEMQLPDGPPQGGLRMRRFAPPEEAISRDDNDEPMPNSVEMRGLRSPVMKGKLPMNIDGKIIKED